MINFKFLNFDNLYILRDDNGDLEKISVMSILVVAEWLAVDDAPILLPKLSLGAKKPWCMPWWSYPLYS